MKSRQNVVVGIDIGGTMTKFGLFTCSGCLLARHSMHTPSSAQGPVDIAYIAEGVKALGEAVDMLEIKPRCVGIGMPMLVTADGNITKCFNVSMSNNQMHRSLKQLFPNVAVPIVNDANAAVLGERWQGALQNCNNAVMVTLGTGVGGGLLVGGKLLAGSHGAAGEIGHITVNDNEQEQCACGKNGCLEQYASATALVKSVQRLLCTGKPSILKTDSLNAKAICDAARCGDALAVHAMHNFAKSLAHGLAIVAVMFDPELFVLGGGLAGGADVFIEQTIECYQAEALSACRETPIICSTLGNDAGIYGAAYLALKGKGLLA